MWRENDVSGSKGVTYAEIIDGTSDTILTVEVADDRAVVWTKPDDFEYGKYGEDNWQAHLHRNKGLNAGLADGSVIFLPIALDDTEGYMLGNGGSVGWKVLCVSYAKRGRGCTQIGTGASG